MNPINDKYCTDKYCNEIFPIERRHGDRRDRQVALRGVIINIAILAIGLGFGFYLGVKETSYAVLEVLK